MKTLTIRPNQRKNEYNDTDRPLLHHETSRLVSPRSALINAKGDIVAVDAGWRALAEATNADWRRIGPGANYLQVCRNASASYNDAASAFTGINAVLTGSVPVFTMDYRCHTRSGWTSFRMAVTPIE